MADTQVEIPSEIATEEAAQAAFHNRLDSAPLEEYKRLRKEGAAAVAAAEPPAEKPVEKPVEAAPAVEEPPAETADAKAARERDEAGRFKGKPKDDPEARKASIQADINRATWEKHEAERQVAEARAEAARIKAETEQARTRPVAEPATTAAFPAFDRWLAANPEKTYDDYQDAKYDARLQSALADRDRRQAEADAQRAFTDLNAKHQARVTTAKQKYADWDQVAAQVAHVMPPPALHAAILQSDSSADILHWLATHPDQYLQVAADVQALPVSSAPLVRKLLESYLGPTAAQTTSPVAVPKKSNASPPPKLVGSSPQVADVDADDESPEQYRLRRRQELAARREAKQRR